MKIEATKLPPKRLNKVAQVVQFIDIVDAQVLEMRSACARHMCHFELSAQEGTECACVADVHHQCAQLGQVLVLERRREMPVFKAKMKVMKRFMARDEIYHSGRRMVAGYIEGFQRRDVESRNVQLANAKGRKYQYQVGEVSHFPQEIGNIGSLQGHPGNTFPTFCTSVSVR